LLLVTDVCLLDEASHTEVESVIISRDQSQPDSPAAQWQRCGSVAIDQNGPFTLEYELESVCHP
jgi:hypothetical protein